MFVIYIFKIFSDLNINIFVPMKNKQKFEEKIKCKDMKKKKKFNVYKMVKL